MYIILFAVLGISNFDSSGSILPFPGRYFTFYEGKKAKAFLIKLRAKPNQINTDASL